MPTVHNFLAAEDNDRVSERFFRVVGAGLKPAPTRISQAPIVNSIYLGLAHAELVEPRLRDNTFSSEAWLMRILRPAQDERVWHVFQVPVRGELVEPPRRRHSG